MSKKFEREVRYIVIKISRLGLSKDKEQREEELENLFKHIPAEAFVESVVVESYWPEYEPVWKMLEYRFTGKILHSKYEYEALQNVVEVALTQVKIMESDQRKILSWCGSLEEAKLNGEFEIKDGVDSWFLRNVKTICQLATIDIKETK